MPITFPNLNGLITPDFIAVDGTESCGAAGVSPAYIYYGDFLAPGIVPGVNDFSATSSLSLCSFVKALSKDIMNSLIPQINTSMSQVAGTLNQTLDVLRCLGFNECVLTGPSACCSSSGGGAPTTIQIQLPNNLSGTNTCYNTNGALDGGSPDNGNITINPVNFKKMINSYNNSNKSLKFI